ncbi:MAG: hypothetical protein RIS45_466 [Planctomycetota bacterium]
MPLSAPLGYDPNSPAPFFGVSVRLGVGGKAVAAPRKLLVLANMIASNLTRADITASDGSTYSGSALPVVAGTATVATPTAVASPEDADTYFGQGSEAALMCRAIFAQKKSADVTVCPVAEGGSAVKATATLLFANAAGSAGVIRLIISGQQVADVAVASGQTAANIAADVAIAINRMGNLPCTAAVSTATVTLSAKQGGVRGNELGLSCELTTTTTTASLNGGTTSTSLVRGRFGTGTATAGSVSDSVTNALAAVATGEYFIAAAHSDTTNAGLIKTHLATYAGIAERKRQQAVMGLKTQSVATAVTFGQTVNATRIQIVYQRDTGSSVVDPWTPCTGELAASVAAARLYGDSTIGNGGTVRGEIAYPAQNLDGVLLGGVSAPRISACAFIATEINQLLNAGITPLEPSIANPGYSRVIKSITSYSLDTNGSLTRAVHDTSCVTVSDYAADRIENAVVAAYPNKNIAPDPTNYIAPPTADVIYPSMVRATILAELDAMELEGLIIDVAANRDGVQVEQNATTKTLIVGVIPTRVIPHFHAFAGELQQLA